MHERNHTWKIEGRARKHFSAIYPGCKSLGPLRIGMVMIAHKISTIHFIKLWKYSRRIDPFDLIT